MDLRNWAAPEWAAFGAVAAVVVYVSLGAIAFSQLAESRRLRKLQTRPYVLVDFVFKGFFVLLEVRNIGTTPARDVRITFDKPLVASDDRRVDSRILDAPIPMVAPGRAIRFPMGRGPAFFKEGSSVPLSYVAHATYTDMTGKQPFNDPASVLDLAPYKYAVVQRDSAADLVSAVREIRTTLNKWGSHRGLQVVAIDGPKHDRWERRQETYARVGGALRNSGVRKRLSARKRRNRTG